MNKKIKILSIDGGGIRGIMPGVILVELEKRLQKKTKNPEARLADFFDFMAGTSTGGILTLGYLMPNEKGRPKLTTQEAVNLYFERGDEIFDASIGQKIKSASGIADEKYDATEIENALQDTFGDIKLSELLKPCLISSYDIEKGKPHFFKQHKSKDGKYNFKVKEIARATSAAPTYFEIARIENDIRSSHSLVDGGVFVNNPALAAYSEARTMKFGDLHFPTAKDMIIVSIGTGRESKQYEYKTAKNWGAIGWIKPVIEIMMSGNSATVDYYLKQIYDTLQDEDKVDYHRLSPQIINADLELDNASFENMNHLKQDTLAYIAEEENDNELNLIVDKLTIPS